MPGPLNSTIEERGSPARRGPPIRRKSVKQSDTKTATTFAWIAFRAVAGRSIHWNAVCLRFAERDFKDRSLEGIIDTTKMPTGSGSHEVGTVRMGKDRRTAVLNSYCQTREARNLFVVGGSDFTTYNEKKPILTIMALAVRTARFIADEVKKRNLKA